MKKSSTDRKAASRERAQLARGRHPAAKLPKLEVEQKIQARDARGRFTGR